MMSRLQQTSSVATGIKTMPKFIIAAKCQKCGEEKDIDIEAFADCYEDDSSIYGTIICGKCGNAFNFYSKIRPGEVPTRTDAEEASGDEGYKGYRDTIEELRKQK